MHKIEVDIKDALLWIRTGIVNGRYEAAIGIIDDIVKQLEAEKEVAKSGD